MKTKQVKQTEPWRRLETTRRVIHASRVIKGDVRNMARDIDGGLFEAKYSLLTADPPWMYNDQKKVRKDGKTPTRGIGANHHYDLLSTADLCDLPVKRIAADVGLLAMWATCPHIPDALQVMEAWGFPYTTVGFAWLKTNSGAWGELEEALNQASFLPIENRISKVFETLFFFGPGNYTGSNLELVLFGRREKGRAFHHDEGRKASQVILAPRDKEHSKKPEIMQNSLLWMYGGELKGKRALEIFARRPRVGFDAYGNEPDKFEYYGGDALG